MPSALKLCLPTALLLAAAVCPSAPAEQTARTAELQQLVERAARHLHLRRETLRGGEAAYHSQRQLLQQTLQAWNDSARTDQDADALEAWLTQIIDSSMRGGRRSTPDAPTFLAIEDVQPAAEVVAAEEVSAEPSPPAQPAPGITPQTAPARRRVASPAFEPDPFDGFAEEQSTAAAAEPVEPTAPQPATPPADAWAHHPAAGQLDWSDPFADDGPAAPRRQGESRRFKPVSQSRSVKIDLLELSSRVAGYNQRLRDLEGMLLSTPDLTAFRLAAIVRDFDDLADQRGFLELYLRGLSREEAEVGPTLEDASAVHRLVLQAVEQRGEDLAGERGSRVEAESAILSALSRKLAEMPSAN